MHGVGHAAGGVLPPELLRLVLHEEGVAALVEGGEDVGDEVVLKVVGGDPDIVGAELRGEGVLRGHEDEGALAEALRLQQVVGEALLLRDGAGPGEEILPDGLALRLDAAHQGHDPLLQGAEEGVHLGLAAALLGVVQAGVVVGRGLLVPEINGLAGEIHHFRQGIPEEGEVRGLLGREPLAVGPVGGHGPGVVKLLRQVLLLLIALPEVLHGLALGEAQALAVRVELPHQGGILRGVGQGVDVLSQQGHVVPRLLHALLRGAALHVEVQLADGPAVGLRLVQDGGEPLPFLLIRHSSSLAGKAVSFSRDRSARRASPGRERAAR